MKKIKIFLVFTMLIYWYLFFEAKNIETKLTFPRVWMNADYSTWNDINYEEINIKDKNWENINWIYVKWDKDIVVYYFHWNWLPLSYFLFEIKYINSLWYSVFAYDYPWYWKSTWVPHEENVNIFSNTFYNYIKKQKEISEKKMILWWYSIWTAVSVDFAKDNNFDKQILFSPLYSRYDMSKSMFWFSIQKYLFLKNSFTTGEYLKHINNDLLVIHWTNDEVISFEQWKNIFDSSISNNKKFIKIDWWKHNWILYLYWEKLKNDIVEFIEN